MLLKYFLKIIFPKVLVRNLEGKFSMLSEVGKEEEHSLNLLKAKKRFTFRLSFGRDFHHLHVPSQLALSTMFLSVKP